VVRLRRRLFALAVSVFMVPVLLVTFAQPAKAGPIISPTALPFAGPVLAGLTDAVMQCGTSCGDAIKCVALAPANFDVTTGYKACVQHANQVIGSIAKVPGYVNGAYDSLICSRSWWWLSPLCKQSQDAIKSLFGDPANNTGTTVPPPDWHGELWAPALPSMFPTAATRASGGGYAAFKVNEIDVNLNDAKYGQNDAAPSDGSYTIRIRAVVTIAGNMNANVNVQSWCKDAATGNGDHLGGNRNIYLQDIYRTYQPGDTFDMVGNLASDGYGNCAYSGNHGLSRISWSTITDSSGGQLTNTQPYFFNLPGYNGSGNAAPLGYYWAAVTDCMTTNGTIKNGEQTQLSANFFALADRNGTPYPAPKPCLDGEVQVGMHMWLAGLDGSLVQEQWNSILPTAARNFLSGNSACWQGVGQGTCTGLVLSRTNGSGGWVNCFTALKSTCEGWFSDPNKATNYQCTYNGAVQSLSSCNVYSPSFDPAYQAAGIPYADPTTGVAPQPAPSDAPQPKPITATPPAPVVAVPLPGTEGQSCWANGFASWNPVDWVLTPGKCAIAWAFVPDSATMTQFVTTVKTAYDATAIGEWSAALAGIGSGLSVPEGGCDGIHATLPLMVTTAQLHIFATCDEPWHTLANVTKAFLTVAIAWFSLAGVFRIIAASFNLNLSWARNGS
jgi:hypothetical protein